MLIDKSVRVKGNFLPANLYLIISFFVSLLSSPSIEPNLKYEKRWSKNLSFIKALVFAYQSFPTQIALASITQAFLSIATNLLMETLGQLPYEQ